jgi:hypothetical protein
MVLGCVAEGVAEHLYSWVFRSRLLAGGDPLPTNQKCVARSEGLEPPTF